MPEPKKGGNGGSVSSLFGAEEESEPSEKSTSRASSNINILDIVPERKKSRENG